MVNNDFENVSYKIAKAKEEMSKVIVGQENLIDKIFISILAKGHILIEGVPGLAKTKTVKTIADVASGSWSRIQFTPDLLPSDIIGSRIFNPKNNDFYTEPGPILNNFILADEINRAPSKVQSALLEALEERQVTIAGEKFKLPDTFIVLATQNPIEQEGTYQLPEAQLDRFMMRIIIEHPNEKEELEIIRRSISEEPKIDQILSVEELKHFQNLVNNVYLSKEIAEEIVRIISLTRGSNNNIISPVLLGASPRASIYLAKASQAKALIEGRRSVRISDVHSLIKDVISHRIVLKYESLLEGISQTSYINELINNLKVK
jgi:MoxR-like ATPase